MGLVSILFIIPYYLLKAPVENDSEFLENEFS
jgi:hypothetical protein